MNFKTLAILPVMALALSSCHNPVFDYEGDCEVHYYLNFVYDMNLKWADAFPSEVKSYNLYVFDQNGLFVKEYQANGPELSQPGYNLELDLKPGDYQLVAWCGISNQGVTEQSFTVPNPVVGQTTIDQLTCRLNTKTSSEFGEYSDTMLNFMYHGNMSVNLPDSQDGQSYYYTMELTKDTNHFRIMLQQLSGEDMDPSNFELRIEDSNGWLAYDNSLLGDTEITYLTWDKFAGVADVEREQSDGSSDLVPTQGVMADLTVSRLMADHKKELFLTVTNTETKEDIITRVPLIQYALLVREYYEKAYGHTLTEQEFLDREDEYVMTFFLDKNLKWLNQSILINSWRVVFHNYGV